MNHLLLRAEELSESGEAILRGERARHLIEVLKVIPGQELRAARLNHERGVAQVLRVSPAEVRVHYQAGASEPVPRSKTLLLAVPRPKVLSRCVQHATALGYRQIFLFRCYRVDKAHLSSSKLSAEQLEQDAWLGLEQARLVHMPELRVFPRFRPFVEDVLPHHETSLPRYLGHPSAETTTASLPRTSQGFILAIGPEGGFIPFEVELLSACAFTSVSAGDNPLRVESALSYLTGQLDLVHG
jgi:16S rRNA (uracil1498-N3)-methyltransferase